MHATMGGILSGLSNYRDCRSVQDELRGEPDILTSRMHCIHGCRILKYLVSHHDVLCMWRMQMCMQACLHAQLAIKRALHL